MGLKTNIFPDTEKLEIVFKCEKQLLPSQKQDPLKPAEYNVRPCECMLLVVHATC